MSKDNKYQKLLPLLATLLIATFTVGGTCIGGSNLLTGLGTGISHGSFSKLSEISSEPVVAHAATKKYVGNKKSRYSMESTADMLKK